MTKFLLPLLSVMFLAVGTVLGCRAFENSCYEFNPDRVTFIKAEDSCDRGHLVDIDSDEENEFVFKVFKESGYSYKSAWIGLNDRVSEGRYVWNSDKRVASYTKWNSGEPNNVVREYRSSLDSGEDCVEMKRLNGKWNDNACRFKLPFICEYDIVKV